MRVITDTLWLPKEGNSSEEYEDAAFPESKTEIRTNRFKCAVADGATETSFSRLWARLLVNGYANRTEISELQSLWHESIADKPLPWYAEEKAISGAFAAFLGLTISSSQMKWKAVAIGDACLFQVRDGSFVEIFPMSESNQFNSTPFLLSSNPAQNKNLDAVTAAKRGSWQDNDRFFLMTDALARWTLKRKEEGVDIIPILDKLKNTSDLETFANGERKELDGEGRPYLRNDDVTLLRLTLMPDSAK